MRFKIAKLKYRHGGQTDAYWEDTGETVEAQSADHAPAAYAQMKGFDPHAALRLTGTMFALGSEEFQVNPE